MADNDELWEPAEGFSIDGRSEEESYAFLLNEVKRMKEQDCSLDSMVYHLRNYAEPLEIIQVLLQSKYQESEIREVFENYGWESTRADALHYLDHGVEIPEVLVKQAQLEETRLAVKESKSSSKH